MEVKLKIDDCSCYVVRFELNDDGLHDAQLIFPDFVIKFDAEQLSDLINVLGRVRLNMLPEISEKIPLSSRPIESVAFPKWHVDIEAMTDGALLHLLHPGFGWLAFTIAGNCLTELRDALSAVVDESQIVSNKCIN